ncbi:MAG TPA: hypothetical protein VE961_00055 [Pyrinomonadaceae bacterium]|nr:hypothetical protein [Pyrinomonadaceae bacterium]
MDLEKQKQRTALLLRWSPALLVGALTAYLLSLRFASFSLSYTLASAVLGLALALVLVVCWRVEARSQLNMFVVILTVMGWEGANWLLQRWRFRGAIIPGWLEFEGLAANLVALSAFLSLFRTRISHFVFGNAEQIAAPEPPPVSFLSN